MNLLTITYKYTVTMKKNQICDNVPFDMNIIRNSNYADGKEYIEEENEKFRIDNLNEVR